MKKPKRNRIFLVVFTTILLLALIVLSSLPGSPLHFLTTPVSMVLRPIESALTRGLDQVTGFYDALTQGVRIRQENEALKLENARLKNTISQLEDADRQYQEFQEAFQLKDRYAHYEILGGRVLTREIGLWFDVFRIDVGSADGLSVSETQSFAVVDAQSNLIGRVVSSDLISAKVLPLIHEGFSVSARVDRPDGALMRVRGSLELQDQGLCLADQITVDAPVFPGDVLVTSGLGGLFPAGIPIGVVRSVDESQTRIQRQAVVEPYVDLSQLTLVFVMKGSQP